jgi:4-diphosphocytidyl-2-C-methyl-D-erythritol kinase
MITLSCPAKINLGLEVVGRRPDGYHELVTIFQQVALADELTAAPARRLSLTCSEPPLAGPANLCWRAALALQAATGCQAGARLALTKRIPIAAGLGGGSSNAAATLLALNRLWRLALSPAQLARLAISLGADVPFFLLPAATALATGIGERLTPLPTPAQGLLIVTPRLELPGKTARLYQLLQPNDWSDGRATRAQAARLQVGLPLEPALIVNAFSRPLQALVPAIGPLLTTLRSAGATTIFLSGSGPSLVILDQPVALARLATSLAAADRYLNLTTTLIHPLAAD